MTQTNFESVLDIANIFRINEWQNKLDWKPFHSGIDIYRLYEKSEGGPRAALLRFHPGGQVPPHEHIGYEHILVLSGHPVDENSRADAGTLIINPPGTSHSVFSETGCIVLAIYEKAVSFSESSGVLDASRVAVNGILLAVNGTLMRGLELHGNLLEVRAEFVRETTTAPTYRLWSINDRHPAMLRTNNGGGAVAVEVWSVPAHGLAALLLKEPAGLSIGKVLLADGTEVLGILGEPALCEGRKDITSFGGWRSYISRRTDGT